MKKFLFLIFILTAACLMTACGKFGMPTDLRFEGRTLTWDKVAKASGYVVDINGTEYETEENSYTLADGVYGVVAMRVKAVSGSKESEYTETLRKSVTWQLDVPQNVVQDGGRIRWDEVPFAQGYVVSIGGVQYAAEEAYYDYVPTARTEFKVLAKGNYDGTLLSSAYSEALMLKRALATPSATASGTGVSWNIVNNASGYEVYVNGEKVDETSSTHYDFRYKFAGEISVAIKAVSGSDEYVDSLLSEEVSLMLAKETLGVPTNLRMEGKTLVWNAVTGATRYVLFNNKEEIGTVSENRYTVPQEYLDADIAELQVRADSDVSDSSPLSEALSVGKYNESNPKPIASYADFAAINPTGHYKLTKDIDMSAAEGIELFEGAVDGNGFALKNVKTAVFDRLEGAEIKNLTVEANVSVTMTKNGDAFGTLARRAVGARIENCKIIADAVVQCDNGTAYAGGVIGVAEYTDMISVSFVGTLTTSYCTVGGLAGKAYNPAAASEWKYCSADVDITATGGESVFCGGFIGQLTDNLLVIRQSKADVGITTDASYSGGFVGYMGTGTVEDCYSTGSVINRNASVAHTGGFIGRMEGYNNKAVRCIAMTAVTAPSGEKIKTGGFVGVTAGGTYGSVYENCFYDNTVAPIDSIGNSDTGRKDGITAKSTEELAQLPYENGFIQAVWSLGGAAPRLAWEKD